MRGAERWFWSSRAGLVLVALVVSTPAPWAVLWGGTTHGDVSPALVGGALWVGLSFVFRRIGRADARPFLLHPMAGMSIALDVLGLTGLLSISGAAQNPFTLLYFVPITLATIVAQKWTFRIAGFSVLGFALLLLQTSLALAEHRHHGHHAHFFQHVRGMAVALAVAGGFVVVFVHRIGRSLARMESRILELSREREHDHFAVSLGALAAGAAHELGSPLGSVQLLAEELPHLSEAQRKDAVQTIVGEVQRMKSIVHGMDSSQLSAEALRASFPWSLGELEEEVASFSVKFEAHGALTVESTQPFFVVGQILRELVRNAVHLSEKETVSVELSVEGDSFTVRVVDEGPGFSPDQLKHASEPFVSHTGGTGLGLFLASVHARQLGGKLTIESEPGQGATVSVELPLRAPPLSPRGVS